MHKLESKIYTISQDSFGNLLMRPFTTHTDGLLKLSNSQAEEINAYADDFLNSDVKAAFKRYNMVYKRGLLMHGVPGTGKTSIIHMLMETAIKKNMIVLLDPQPSLIKPFVSSIRSIEGIDRPVMVVWEEFEDWLENYEGSLLNLLDGAAQLDNIFFVATTNYIGQIPARIQKRPSRFADVIEIVAPDANMRRAFIKGKIHPEDQIDLERWVVLTDGLVIDHLKELIIRVLVLKKPLEESVEKIRELSVEEDEEDAYDDDDPDTDDYCTPKYSSTMAVEPPNCG